MNNEDEFQKADVEAGVGMEVLPPQDVKSSLPSPVSDVIRVRSQLVSEYHKGAPSLADRLRKAGREDVESLIVAMIDEVIQETDHLLGNELIATHNGELRDASVISFKRAEVLEKAIRAVQTKQQLEKQGGIDVDSPSMMVIFRFFLSKAKDTFTRMGVDSEINDLFFRMFGEVTENWKKELRESFNALRNPR